MLIAVIWGTQPWTTLEHPELCAGRGTGRPPFPDAPWWPTEESGSTGNLYLLLDMVKTRFQQHHRVAGWCSAVLNRFLCDFTYADTGAHHILDVEATEVLGTLQGEEEIPKGRCYTFY